MYFNANLFIYVLTSKKKIFVSLVFRFLKDYIGEKEKKEFKTEDGLKLAQNISKQNTFSKIQVI